MDALGAIVGPATAFVLIQWLGLDFRAVFIWTLVPGVIAMACVTFLVKERTRLHVSSVSFGEGLRRLPPQFRRFLVAVGLFGAGDFARIRCSSCSPRRN